MGLEGNTQGHVCPPYIKLVKYSIRLNAADSDITPDTESAGYGSWYLWILYGLCRKIHRQGLQTISMFFYQETSKTCFIISLCGQIRVLVIGLHLWDQLYFRYIFFSFFKNDQMNYSILKWLDHIMEQKVQLPAEENVTLQWQLVKFRMKLKWKNNIYLKWVTHEAKDST